MFLMGMINMDDKGSRYSVQNLEPALNLHLPYPHGELQRAASFILLWHVACGMEHWHKSEGELPGNFTQ